MSSYYEKIDGVSCDRGIVDACREAVKGQGDGRVSVEDAKLVFQKVADGGRETETERWTVRYCLAEFNFTEAARKWLVESCKDVVQEAEDEEPAVKKRRLLGGAYYETVDGVGCDRGIVDACREAVDGAGDGRISVDDAKKVFDKVADGGTATQCERWTLRYCMTEFNWTDAAHDWFVEAMKTLNDK